MDQIERRLRGKEQLRADKKAEACGEEVDMYCAYYERGDEDCDCPSCESEA